MRCCPPDPVTGLSSLEVVVLHPDPPEGVVLALGAMGPTRVVRGSPADRRTLEAAGAAQARWGGDRAYRKGGCAEYAAARGVL